MNKVASYTKKAQDKYLSKFDRCVVNLPKGAREDIKQLSGKSINQYLNDLVKADLERLRTNQSEPTEADFKGHQEVLGELPRNEPMLKKSVDINDLQAFLELRRLEISKDKENTAKAERGDFDF